MTKVQTRNKPPVMEEKPLAPRLPADLPGSDEPSKFPNMTYQGGNAQSTLSESGHQKSCWLSPLTSLHLREIQLACLRLASQGQGGNREPDNSSIARAVIAYAHKLLNPVNGGEKPSEAALDLHRLIQSALNPFRGNRGRPSEDATVRMAQTESRKAEAERKRLEKENSKRREESVREGELRLETLAQIAELEKEMQREETERVAREQQRAERLAALRVGL